METFMTFIPFQIERNNRFVKIRIFKKCKNGFVAIDFNYVFLSIDMHESSLNNNSFISESKIFNLILEIPCEANQLVYILSSIAPQQLFDRIIVVIIILIFKSYF